MNHLYTRELETALAAVRRASAICRSVQAGIPTSLDKQDKSPVTVADYSSQALICKELGEAFPHDPVIAEEDSGALRAPGAAEFLQRTVEHVQRQGIVASGEDVCRWIDRGRTTDYTPRFWTLDPIDGTKGFLRKEQYAIALALIVEGKVAVAAVACPNLPFAAGDASRIGVVFTAVAGSGAWAHPLDSADAPVRIAVTPTADPGAARFCESVESGHSAHDASAVVARDLGITAPPARLDSQAKYGVVARGEADVYLRLPTRADYQEKIWDHAAGCLVVMEAGGTATDVAGRPLEFTHGRTLAVNRGVVVSNGRFHDRLIAALGRAGVS